MNLQVFCDPKMDEKARYFLAKPWIRGGWQYATDGKIVVRIPADGQPDTEGRKLPQIVQAFARFRECLEPWPALDHKDIPCRECNGTGEKFIKCPYCDKKIHVPSDEKCLVCHGGKTVHAISGVPAQRVRGKKVTIGSWFYDSWYLDLIEDQCEGIQYSVSVVRDEPLCFTAAGGMQGMLMPLDF